MPLIHYIAGPVVCYLLGAAPFGLLAGKMKGVDIRREGSGNIGATNAARVLGRPWFFVVFALDFLKGIASVALIFWLFAGAHGKEIEIGECNLQVIYGLAAIAGHMFPVYLGFRGGKGIAVSAGVFAILTPFAFFAAFAVFLLVYLASRYVSLGSICAAVAFSASYFLFAFLLYRGGPFAPNVVLLSAACVLLTLLVIFKHRSNIARLLGGKELKV
ncbi:MAG: acyl-phosphate glycerol 3-phosphate acyltransferase [Planctomycetota bacterium]|nr:MAG: acyl-phosphate glycerol 3-phosphate acyltransferase [Planctomycetota bacterium]